MTFEEYIRETSPHLSFIFDKIHPDDINEFLLAAEIYAKIKPKK